MIPMGAIVRSSMGQNVQGKVVGYGIIQWPSSPDIWGDGVPQVVYLVQTEIGSSSLGPACVVMREDRTMEVVK
jgi:hypothetical protein